jgi:hypothetical protein
MNQKMKIAVAAVWLSAIALGMGKYASAQLTPPPAPDDAGSAPRATPRFGPGGGGPRGGFGGFFGGGTQMAVSGNNLFILRGNTLYRVNSQSLKVEAQGDLPQPQMPGAPGGQTVQ